MRSLCVITHGYPCRANPALFAFTREFARAVARRGVAVTVIAPLPLHTGLRFGDPWRETERDEDGSEVEVFRPRYISLSNYRIASWSTEVLNLEAFNRSVGKVLRSGKVERPDAFYGHFLYLGGATAVRFGRLMGIPAFPMVGDGHLNSMEPFGADRARVDFRDATAFMTNSTRLAEELEEGLGVDPGRVGIFPNGVDRRTFHPRDKLDSRAALGLPEDGFFVICVGFQDLQKGPARVGEAITGLAGVSGLFLGLGPNPPRSENILFNGQVPHSQVSTWLAAADLFVLPSTYEGSCNAAVEALACGVPVVIAKGRFNDDIANVGAAIRVDPLDVGEIRDAIVRLRDDPALLARMARAASDSAANFDIDLRVKHMLEFMGAHAARPTVDPGLSRAGAAP